MALLMSSGHWVHLYILGIVYQWLNTLIIHPLKIRSKTSFLIRSDWCTLNLPPLGQVSRSIAKCNIEH